MSSSQQVSEPGLTLRTCRPRPGPLHTHPHPSLPHPPPSRFRGWLGSEGLTPPPKPLLRTSQLCGSGHMWQGSAVLSSPSEHTIWGRHQGGCRANGGGRLGPHPLFPGACHPLPLPETSKRRGGLCVVSGQPSFASLSPENPLAPRSPPQWAGPASAGQNP